MVAGITSAAIAPAADRESGKAQGPSSRAAVRTPTVYKVQQAADSYVDKERPTLEGEIGSAVENSGRRLSLGGSSPTSNATVSRGSTLPGSKLIGSWAKGSGLTAAAALAFVVGLFMLFAWVVKRGMPKSSQVLPADAVRILGRVPLGGRQFGQLLQLGNKLVLVSVTQTGVEKLAEIDDPQEVIRLVAMCASTSTRGSQKEFEEIFGKFATEKAEPGFLGGEASLFSDSKSSGDYGSTNGGRRYA